MNLRSKVRRTGVRAVELALQAVGFDVLERDYYSPLVPRGSVSADVWARPRDTPAVDIDALRDLGFLDRELRPHLNDFHPRLDDDGSPGFFLHNEFYGPVDAEVLHAMLRHLKPQRMVELGSGFSTLVALHAHRANALEGHSTDFRVFDPYAGDHMTMSAPELATIERVPATAVPMEEFERLEAGDVLFVDTTHTVKIGGDVNRLILEVLPRLRRGVVVHVHDIYLPWEYPRHLVERQRRHWGEQYLLQAFLAMNPYFAVIFAAHAVARACGNRLRDIIPSFEPWRTDPPWATPSAFWIVRTG